MFVHLRTSKGFGAFHVAGIRPEGRKLEGLECVV
jgi:hypothetical protein